MRRVKRVRFAVWVVQVEGGVAGGFGLGGGVEVVGSDGLGGWFGWFGSFGVFGLFGSAGLSGLSILVRACLALLAKAVQDMSGWLEKVEKREGLGWVIGDAGVKGWDLCFEFRDVWCL